MLREFVYIKKKKKKKKEKKKNQRNLHLEEFFYIQETFHVQKKNYFKNSRSQMFLKLGVLQNFS